MDSVVMPRAVFDRVSKRFGERVVFENLSFELKRGGRYGLAGPNGSGKSTLLKLAAGLLCPDQGTVLAGGLDPWRCQVKVRGNMGLLPEGAPLVGELTVAEHLALAGRLRRLPDVDFKREETRLVEALNLAPFYRRPAGVLSLGQKRRAALASALLGGPDFLLLDEPTSGLDPEEAARLMALLSGLPVDSTLLVSSHILTEIFELTDEILVLDKGRLAAFGPWNVIISKTAPTEAELRKEYLALIRPEA